MIIIIFIICFLALIAILLYLIGQVKLMNMHLSALLFEIKSIKDQEALTTLQLHKISYMLEYLIAMSIEVEDEENKDFTFTNLY